MHFHNLLIENSNDDNFSDRWFFVQLVQATLAEASLTSLLTTAQFQLGRTDILKWAKRTKAIFEKLDAYHLVVRWVHTAALNWSAFEGSNLELRNLEKDIAECYLGRFGNRIPFGWNCLFQSFHSSSSDSFHDDLPMPPGHDLYLLTHQVLTRSQYLNSDYKLSQSEVSKMNERLARAVEDDNAIIEDIDLECLLILFHSQNATLALVDPVCTKAQKITQTLQKSESKRDLRESYHYLLLLTLIERMLGAYEPVWARG